MNKELGRRRERGMLVTLNPKQTFAATARGVRRTIERGKHNNNGSMLSMQRCTWI